MTHAQIKETADKIVALLDGFSYGNAVETLNAVKLRLNDLVLIVTVSNEGVLSDTPVRSRLSSEWECYEFARKRCETCPGKAERYSAILDSLPRQHPQHI